MIKRSIGVYYDLTPEQKEWWDKGDVCPMCGLPHEEWDRRLDWRCCSTDCTAKLLDQTFYWPDVRRKVFIRDKWTCIKCGLVDKNKLGWTLVADHIIPICLGGDEWDMDNIQTLCRRCDKIKTKQDYKDIAKQRRIEKKQAKN